MEPLLSCIPCIIKQIIYSVRSVSGDDWLQKRIVSNALKYLSDIEYKVLPITLAKNIFKQTVDSVGVSSPFQDQKKELFENFTDILEKIRSKAPEVDRDRICAAVKMAAAASHFVGFIDFDETFEKIIDLSKRGTISFEHDKFSKEYKKKNKVVLLADGFIGFPFDVYLLSLLGMEEIRLAVDSRPFLSAITTEEIEGLGKSIPFNAEIRTVTHSNSGEDRSKILNDDGLIISKGFINYQYYCDSETVIAYLFYANKWCQPSMVSLGLKNKPKNGIVLKFNL